MELFERPVLHIEMASRANNGYGEMRGKWPVSATRSPIKMCKKLLEESWRSLQPKLKSKELKNFNCCIFKENTSNEKLIQSEI